jgi:magnesium transporter
MITIIAYSKKEGLRAGLPTEQLMSLLADLGNTVWIDLEAPTAEEATLLSRDFNFHPLAIEDCVAETLLPKIDDFGDYLFMVFHGSRAATAQAFDTVEINFFLGDRYLVTYHDEPSRSIARTKDRCMKMGPAITQGADFLLHDILDGLVDNYFPILEQFDKTIDEIEEEVCGHPDKAVLNRIFDLKRDVMRLRRVTGPQRDILNRLSRDSFRVIRDKTAIYFRDVYDHLARMTEWSESHRDLISGAMEAYLSSVSNRLNEVMKVLTIFTATLMPLTLITGIYGMNFDYMPELRSRYGYYGVLIIMLGVMVGMFSYFRRKKWI